MEVYHGSYLEIDEIDLSKGRENRDFGRGFYVTKFLEQAEFWAARMGRTHKCKGVVTEFHFIENAFKHFEFSTLRFADYSEEWLDFVVLNRNLDNPQPAHNYDIIEGPVADDDVTERINFYLRGDISKSDFLKELTYHKKTHQICFCTLKSLQAITKTQKDKIAYNLNKSSQKVIFALVTENGLEHAEAADKFYTSKTFANLADETTKFYEKDWTEIYELLKQELSNT